MSDAGRGSHPRCSGICRNGKRCKRPATFDGNVCTMHSPKEIAERDKWIEERRERASLRGDHGFGPGDSMFVASILDYGYGSTGIKAGIVEIKLRVCGQISVEGDFVAIHHEFGDSSDLPRPIEYGIPENNRVATDWDELTKEYTYATGTLRDASVWLRSALDRKVLELESEHLEMIRSIAAFVDSVNDELEKA